MQLLILMSFLVFAGQLTQSDLFDSECENVTFFVGNYKTTPLLPEYFQENKGKSSLMNSHHLFEDKPYFVTYLHSRELSNFRVSFKNGLLYHKGKLLDTHGFPSIFVMNESGEFFVIDKEETRDLYHSSLLSGQPVAGAGIMIVDQGLLKYLSNESGHYRPSPEIFEQVCQELRSKNILCEKLDLKIL